MLDVERAFSEFCEGRSCSSCPFDTIVPEDEDCHVFFVQHNPDEAIRIMGLEDEDGKDEHFEFNEDAFKDLMGGMSCLNA